MIKLIDKILTFSVLFRANVRFVTRHRKSNISQARIPKEEGGEQRRRQITENQLFS